MARSTKSKRKKPTKVGRPSIFDPDRDVPVVRKLLAQGRGMGEVADALRISRDTLYAWKEKYPEFSDAIERGKEDADERIERSLFDRAAGYEQVEEKLLVVSGGQGMGSSVERHLVTERVAADVTAIKFWLTNRRRKYWSDKQKIEHEGTLTLEQMLAQSWGKPAEQQAEAPKGDG